MANNSRYGGGSRNDQYSSYQSRYGSGQYESSHEGSSPEEFRGDGIRFNREDERRDNWRNPSENSYNRNEPNRGGGSRGENKGPYRQGRSFGYTEDESFSSGGQGRQDMNSGSYNNYSSFGSPGRSVDDRSFISSDHDDFSSGSYGSYGAGRSRSSNSMDSMMGRSSSSMGRSNQPSWNENSNSRDSYYGNDRSYGSSTSNSWQANHTGRGPKGWKRSDERIREEVCDCLERDPRVDASEIEVMVKEGVVTLSGKVEDRRTKRAAEDAIEMLSGVKDVRNELSVDQSFFQQAKEMLMGSSSSSDNKSTKTSTKTNPH